ncbi:hypothetical protein PSEUBRA_006022 [Kalmanozyma brasiliensis GHG001]|uniref:Uncharacterized protein n=1 Tax=Kalmanozyma brasiliensis (strain GHG001) TaxID=1365824 RepID=V5ES87_KALBG|nr:uncharacterized protein PSEUBRA_006022 [Kalmanozyma brasiliensis GHG001]EST04739.1 hypothetical protein PSEUBRA_006022 [Kalmanozyma brasiliensis GHG001]
MSLEHLVQLRLLVLLATLAIASGAVLVPELTNEEADHHLFSYHRYLFAFEPPQLHAQYVEYYPHLSVSHPNLEKDALDFAKTAGNGPFYAEASSRFGPKALFVSTKVSGNSRLGRTWNLRHNNDGRVKVYDAQLFWRVDRRGPKLLRFGIWPEGSHPQQVIPMQEVIDRFPRRFRWFHWH